MSETKVVAFLGGPNQSIEVEWSSELAQGSWYKWPGWPSTCWRVGANTAASWQGLGEGSVSSCIIDVSSPATSVGRRRLIREGFENGSQ